MGESEDDVKAALGRELAALGDDVVDYLAAAICDELVNHPPRAPRAPLLASMVDILYPFLLVRPRYDTRTHKHTHTHRACINCCMHPMGEAPAAAVFTGVPPPPKAA